MTKMTKVKVFYLIIILKNSSKLSFKLTGQEPSICMVQIFEIKDEAQCHHNFSHFSSF